MAHEQALRSTLARVEQVAVEQLRPGYDGPRWDQRTWRTVTDCGTAMCFAGHAIDLHPAARWMDDVDSDYGWDTSIATLEHHDPEGLFHAPFAAQRVLGLTDDQANALFYEHNDLEDLQALVGLILDGETDREVLRQHTARDEWGEPMPESLFASYHY